MRQRDERYASNRPFYAPKSNPRTLSEYSASDAMSEMREAIALEAKENNLRTKFGITLAQFNQRKADQLNTCLICGEVFKKTPSVDHCHECHTIRALLCNNCNAGLGFFKDDIRRLAAAIVYLQDHTC